jgi:hypothetical protein
MRDAVARLALDEGVHEPAEESGDRRVRCEMLAQRDVRRIDPSRANPERDPVPPIALVVRRVLRDHADRTRRALLVDEAIRVRGDAGAGGEPGDAAGGGHDVPQVCVGAFQ